MLTTPALRHETVVNERLPEGCVFNAHVQLEQAATVLLHRWICKDRSKHCHILETTLHFHLLT